MVKYYDCSINDISNNNHLISNRGPKENDIMCDLGKYAKLFGYERVYDYKKSDIIITNTIYPNDILNWSIDNKVPKVKRMDGIHWRINNLDKNIELNIAAHQSDIVIFISEYSRRTLNGLYNFLPNKNYVILNDVDESFFYPRSNSGHDKFTSISSCTNWNRVEKRLKSIIDLSIKNPNDDFLLIGICEDETPSNIKKIGYIDSQDEMAEIISSADIFISPFYRDAAPKVVCQSIKCGVPVLYSSSGGNSELVGGYGVSVKDDEEINFKVEVPDLDMNDGYLEIKRNYDSFDRITNAYLETIEQYFKIFNLTR